MTRIPVEVYQYLVTDDWCSIKVEGPEHTVIEIEGFPDNPFASGSFQVAFKAKRITPCRFLTGTEFIFKQHNIDEYGVSEQNPIMQLTEESFKELERANERKTAKEVQVAAVCCSMCHHFSQECRTKIKDFGKEISVIPSVHVKLKSGQFPPWGSMEPYIQGRWYKFINNDGQVVDIGENPSEEVVEFGKKCQAFSHWTYKRFQGKAVVCDLQGTDFQLTDLEIASSDGSLFGIGNLSHYALEMFKMNHTCNVYCAALELEALESFNPNDLEQILASPELFSSSSGEENLEPLSALLERAPRQDSSIPLKHPSQKSNELICQICLVENIDCIFYSCGHMYCCNSCALKLNESNNCCPVCRKVITEIVKVYR
ncbi:alpha-protein kinase 1-like [Acropora palmata]|uniref:alpha-protein kinase 1-like n=1 Tax=Acropora palmata TaxID=6131 RepID=UPI003DA13F18